MTALGRMQPARRPAVTDRVGATAPLRTAQALRSARSSCTGGVLLDEPYEFVTDWVDLVDVPLEKLRSLDNPILTKALQRVAEEARDPVDVVAGFQAAI